MRVGFAGGELLLAGNGQLVGETLRVRIDARDVSLTLSQHNDTSILNAIPAIVTEVAESLSQGAVLVKLRLCNREDAGQGSTEVLLSRITRRSAEHLELVVGSRVWAQIKSVAVLR